MTSAFMLNSEIQELTLLRMLSGSGALPNHNPCSMQAESSSGAGEQLASLFHTQAGHYFTQGGNKKSKHIQCYKNPKSLQYVHFSCFLLAYQHATFCFHLQTLSRVHSVVGPFIETFIQTFTVVLSVENHNSKHHRGKRKGEMQSSSHN